MVNFVSYNNDALELLLLLLANSLKTNDYKSFRFDGKFCQL